MAMSTAIWFAVVLGGLLGVTLVAGLFKLWLNKRKLKRDTEKGHIAAVAKADREKNIRKPVGEGDLFGVKAIQNGYFGGVAQSRPASPAPSYILAPGQTLVDWGKSSANSSFASLPRFPDSQSTFVPGQKPSPLRLQSPDHPPRKSLNPSIGVGGAYMPPLPSSRDNRAVTPFLDSEIPPGWVPPLDVHFSRPSTPLATPNRPTSYLPKLNFPSQFEKSGFLVPTQANSGGGAKSEEASIISTEISVSAPLKAAGSTSPGPSPSPTASLFPQSRKARQSNRSFFNSTAIDDRPSSRRSNKSFNSGKSPRAETFPDLPVPLHDLPPQVPVIDPSNFPFDNRQWSTEKAVVRDSIVSKHRASLFQPGFDAENGPVIRNSIVSKHRVSLFQPGADPHDASSRHSRIQSIAASSIYSARTSIVDPSDNSPFALSIPKSAALPPNIPEVPQIPARSRSRSRSTSTSMSRKSRSSSSTSARLTRSHDSIRLQHLRKSSHESLAQPLKFKRRSKDRDALHFDPSSTNRNRSGSIAGRKVDFDHPRESPFSNANIIERSVHSASSSVSSAFTAESHQTTNSEIETQIPVPQLPKINNTTLLSAANPFNPFNDRPASEASQVSSVGEVYDSYYKPAAAQRQSVLEQAKAIGNASAGRARNDSVGGGAKRPPPLRLGVNGGLGISGSFDYGVGNTIVEMPTPLTGGSSEKERFPRML